MKFRGFEFEDQKWFPDVIRESMTDYLRFLFQEFNLYEPTFPLLKDALAKNNSTQIVDLGSGSGGANENIYNYLKQNYSSEIKINLSDLFPNVEAFQRIYYRTFGGIIFINTPVDATNVPSDAKGFRTMFSGIHHFNREKAKKVLRNAVDAGQGIGIFDGGNKNFLMVLLIIIFHPILLLLCTPFIKPFRISRLLFTYLIPIIPFCTVWDGIFSIFRLYKPKELLQMANEVENDNYIWTSGKVRNKFGMSIAYLIGYPTVENI